MLNVCLCCPVTSVVEIWICCMLNVCLCCPVTSVVEIWICSMVVVDLDLLYVKCLSVAVTSW